MKRGLIWSVLLLVVGMVGCSKTPHHYISVEIAEGATMDSLWYLYTYGEKRISIDTLEAQEKGTIKWDKTLDTDSIDLLLLYNSQGLLEVPILPDREGNITIYLDKERLTLMGTLETDSIQSWYRAKKIGTAGLLSFLSEYQSNGIALVMAADALVRDERGDCHEELKALQNKLASRYPEMKNLLGYHFATHRRNVEEVPHGFRVSGEEEQKPFRKLIGKRALMVINVMALTPEDSTAFARQKSYFTELDSLGLLSYNVLLNDTLPKGVSEGKNRYFMVDSIGNSLEYIRDYDIQHIPTYMLVDSTRQVWRTWAVSDSLVEFIKQYRDVGRRVE